ncbi:MAG: hypothetical protein KKF48_00870 [Nanoarchaeota archaeon]|nr:hypothetical protein [Nanoarchaeota archaeon]MBU1027575.1 hypothetical protein [Nanoarchaeota archaeon]
MAKKRYTIPSVFVEIQLEGTIENNREEVQRHSKKIVQVKDRKEGNYYFLGLLSYQEKDQEKYTLLTTLEKRQLFYKDLEGLLVGLD